jgi:hypothetical protein
MHPGSLDRSAPVLVALSVLGFYLGLASCGSDEGMSAPSRASGASKTVSWSAVPEPVLGYKLYWGTRSHEYDSHVDVGPDVSYTVSGLQSGNIYYFAVSAYNGGGESTLSAEVSSVVE